MKQEFAKRVALVTKALPTNGALLLTSSSQKLKSADQFYPHRQDSDFYYMTGSKGQNQALIIFGNSRQPIFIVKRQDKRQKLWDGPEESVLPVVRRLNAKLVYTSQIEEEVLKSLPGLKALFLKPLSEISKNVSKRLLSFESSQMPTQVQSSDDILVPLRVKKSPVEIEKIEKAIEITQHAINETVSVIVPGVTERLVRATINYWFEAFESESGFDTIVAASQSAAILHYQKCERILKNGDLVLIDCGATFDGYSADVTRTFPVGGAFAGIYRDLYQIVLDAQYAAIGKIQDGVKTKVVYNAAAKVLTQGLIDLKVLKGSLIKNLETGAFKKYFPHGIGHSLGLDVHDVGNIRGNNESVLKAGMVITIEPGLYFLKKIGNVPSLGVRIEDDVLVTRTGCRVLSKSIPKEMKEIETMIEFSSLEN